MREMTITKCDCGEEIGVIHHRLCRAVKRIPRRKVVAISGNAMGFVVAFDDDSLWTYTPLWVNTGGFQPTGWERVPDIPTEGESDE